jgi:S-adenosylmethionine uptake transporter
MKSAHPLLPFVAALAGVAVFSIMDALMKQASIGADVYNALFFRSLCGTALMLPLWLLTGGRWPHRAVLRVHMLRSSVVAVMAWLFFWGLVRLPMAEAIALSFIAPVIALYLAAVTLGETIQRRAVVASLLGFAGVMLIGATRLASHQGGKEAALGIAAVLGSAVMYAWNLVLQRQQAQIAGPQEIAFFQNLGIALLLTLIAPWFAMVPSAAVLRDIGIGAFLSATALMLLAWSYARAEAQVLVATEYTAFIWAALMGWLWFDEKVTASTLGGVILIVAACWIAARRRTEQTAL